MHEKLSFFFHMNSVLVKPVKRFLRNIEGFIREILFKSVTLIIYYNYTGV